MTRYSQIFVKLVKGNNQVAPDSYSRGKNRDKNKLRAKLAKTRKLSHMTFTMLQSKYWSQVTLYEDQASYPEVPTSNILFCIY